MEVWYTGSILGLFLALNIRFLCSWVSRDQGWIIDIISENISCLFSLCCVRSLNRCKKEVTGVMQQRAGCKGKGQVDIRKPFQKCLLFSRLQCSNILDSCIIIFVSWQWYMYFNEVFVFLFLRGGFYYTH